MEKELKKYMSNVDEVIALLKKKVERLEGEKKEAEQRAERYEKALKEIQAKATFPRTENESGVTIYNILKACNEALPKTSTDEHT